MNFDLEAIRGTMRGCSADKNGELLVKLAEGE